jgi:hypothetical protein
MSDPHQLAVGLARAQARLTTACGARWWTAKFHKSALSGWMCYKADIQQLLKRPVLYSSRRMRRRRRGPTRVLHRDRHERARGVRTRRSDAGARPGRAALLARSLGLSRADRDPGLARCRRPLQADRGNDFTFDKGKAIYTSFGDEGGRESSRTFSDIMETAGLRPRFLSSEPMARR